MFAMPQQPRPQAPRPAQQAAPVRTAGNNRYLPAMPDMLKPRTPQQPEKTAPQVASNPEAKVVIRGQQGEETPQRLASQPAKLSIPSPEELGLLKPAPTSATPASGSMDWTTARDRLEKYGAVHYRLERAGDGWCFVCAMPNPLKPNTERQFEVRAATDQEAMSLLLQQVEAWRTHPRAE